MQSRQTYSILPIIRKSRVNAQGEVPIYIRITVNGKRQEFLSKQWVEIDQWDSRKGRVKGNKENARIINAQLEHIRTRLNSIYNELDKDGGLITATAIKVDTTGNLNQFGRFKVSQSGRMKVSRPKEEQKIGSLVG
ncbi:Arm DNA-binding domain-containing protein [Catalinimonas sp. 4WD22]|uniref:Arm DNA-binding domain-containing protein n=1 Tax=Catalinimonas locisalis TaxID=3133978 RepID=UPI0031011F08